jgi:hypothetical protein
MIIVLRISVLVVEVSLHLLNELHFYCFNLVYTMLRLQERRTKILHCMTRTCTTRAGTECTPQISASQLSKPFKVQWLLYAPLASALEIFWVLSREFI